MKKYVYNIATGGTIVGTHPNAGATTGYQPGVHSIEDLISALPASSNLPDIMANFLNLTVHTHKPIISMCSATSVVADGGVNLLNAITSPACFEQWNFSF